jgi:hypothetical protein
MFILFISKFTLTTKRQHSNRGLQQVHIHCCPICINKMCLIMKKKYVIWNGFYHRPHHPPPTQPKTSWIQADTYSYNKPSFWSPKFRKFSTNFFIQIFVEIFNFQNFYSNYQSFTFLFNFCSNCVQFLFKLCSIFVQIVLNFFLSWPQLLLFSNLWMAFIMNEINLTSKITIRAKITTITFITIITSIPVRSYGLVCLVLA